jgi:predicted  nucleic acid-binding Zn-ribbon protein
MLGRLLEIQVIDMEMADLRNKAALIPIKIADLDSTVASERRSLEKSKSRRMHIEKDRDAVELDIEAKAATLHKWEIQLYAIKTNKEYQAMLIEIGSVKTDINLLEDRMLELMDQVEKVAAEVSEHKQALADGIARKEVEEKELGAKLDVLRSQIASLHEKRKPVVADIDETLFATYERIRKAKRGGPSVVPVLDTTCSGCHMQVPAQVINEIMADDITHTCRMCSRILFCPDNYPSAAVSVPASDAGDS